MKQPYSYSGLSQSWIKLQPLTTHDSKGAYYPFLGDGLRSANGMVTTKGMTEMQVVSKFLNTRTNTTTRNLSTCHLHLKHNKMHSTQVNRPEVK